jgi:hypothetical protein
MTEIAGSQPPRPRYIEAIDEFLVKTIEFLVRN